MKNVLKDNQFIGELELKSPLNSKEESIKKTIEWIKTILP